MEGKRMSAKTNEYKWSFRGTCPINRRSDKYWATLVTNGMVEVEKLIEFCETRKLELIFQEDWTAMLQEAFGGEVTLVGYHSGVKIKSTVR